MGNTKGVEVELFRKKGTTDKDVAAVMAWLGKTFEKGSLSSFHMDTDGGLTIGGEVQTYSSIEEDSGKIRAEGITSWMHFEDQLILEATKHKMYGTIKVRDFDAPGHWTVIIPKELTYSQALRHQKAADGRLNSIAQEAMKKHGRLAS